MALPSEDYDYLLKVLLIGDSGKLPLLYLLSLDFSRRGVGKSSLLVRFSEGSFSTSYLPTMGIDFRNRNIEMHGKRIKLQIWDTAGQERFRTITRDIRSWMLSIEQHASDNVNKILVGNKADMGDNKRAVPTSKGQALANEYGIKFFETSAKTSRNVEKAFFSITRDIKQRLDDTESMKMVLKLHLP
ncbi:Ras- protein RABE1c, variant 2 [Lathyrus oleraceus]|uniref:Ras- protein RABE1c, variant 2 n=1 Tax=Pisum sativum TaxID=3888 RepID=A0A9D4X459_PEA|nr:Ras- protein RABE1c, variant 2 [Pisum sativum]